MLRPYANPNSNLRLAPLVIYNLTDPALLQLARIVRAADTEDHATAPEGEGLRQIANGWHLLE